MAAILLVAVHLGAGAEKDFTAVFAQEVNRRLDLPEADQNSYGDLMVSLLAARTIDRDQYVVIVDRSELVQAAIIFLLTPEHTYRFIGASPVSTGKPGRFDHFTTPLGVFEHTVDNLDFRALGTKNTLGYRGYGGKGSRIYDFGWQQAARAGAGPAKARSGCRCIPRIGIAWRYGKEVPNPRVALGFPLH